MKKTTLSLMLFVFSIGLNAQLLDEGFDDITTLPGNGWSEVNASTTIGSTGWFQGNDATFPAFDGSANAYIAANFNSTTGANTISNWLITPVLSLSDGDEISFYTRTVTNPATWPDRLEVRLSTDGAGSTDPVGPGGVGSYTTLLLEINPTISAGGYPAVWTQYTITVAGVGANVDSRIAFRYHVTNGGPSGANSNYIGIDRVVVEQGVNPFPDPYCGPLNFPTAVEPITRVLVADIDNISSAVVNGSPAHEDFTSIVGNMIAGDSYPIALEGNTDGSYTNRFVVFIDWNQNGILDDPGEVFEMDNTIFNSTGLDGQQALGTITVPLSAIPGQTRMRVKKIFSTTNFLDPCLGANYGQAEDYTINVSVGTPPPNDLIQNAISVTNETQPYTDPSVNLQFATLEPFNPSGCSLTGANGVWYSFTAPAAGLAEAHLTSPNGLTALVFYSAPSENVSNETELTYVPGADNPCALSSSSSITTTAGQSYYIFVMNTGGASDVVIDISQTMSIEDNTIDGFTFYPNPVENVLNLKSNVTIDKVELFSVLGQSVLTRSIEANNSQIDVSRLTTGVYLMKVTADGQTATYQVIKK